MTAHALPINFDKALRNEFFKCDDPGASGTFFIEHKGIAIARVVTAAAESRVLPAASGFGVGQELVVIFDTDGGDLTITGAAQSVVLTEAGDVVVFKVGRTKSGSTVTKNWRVVADSRVSNRVSLLMKGVKEGTTATATDTATITAAQVLGGFIHGTPVSAATYTLPTAALLVAAIPGAKVGMQIRLTVLNDGADTDNITVASGSGGTDEGSRTIEGGQAKDFLIVLTNVTASSEAYTLVGIGDPAA